MEREELLQEVQSVIEADGKQLSPSISEETINAELDDELENIGDDEEANRKVFGRIAKRLLRMDGNIHSNVSREVKSYKEKNPYKKPTEKTAGKTAGTEGGEGDSDNETLKLLKGLSERIDRIEQSRKDRESAAAKDAAIEAVKDGLTKKFKEAKVEVNDYIYRQTLRDLEIPDVEDGKSVDTDALVKKMESAYYRNLKAAGLDKKETSKPHKGGQGGGSGASSKLDAMFRKKHPEWGKKE